MARTSAENGMELMTWSVSTRAAPTLVLEDHGRGPARSPLDADDRALEKDLDAGLLDQVPARLPHHPGAELRDTGTPR